MFHAGDEQTVLVRELRFAIQESMTKIIHPRTPIFNLVGGHHVGEKVSEVESKDGERPQEGLRDQEQEAPDVVGHRVDTCRWWLA